MNKQYKESKHITQTEIQKSKLRSAKFVLKFTARHIERTTITQNIAKHSLNGTKVEPHSTYEKPEQQFH